MNNSYVNSYNDYCVITQFLFFSPLSIQENAQQGFKKEQGSGMHNSP